MHKYHDHAMLQKKWKSLIQACQNSPLTIAAFARDHKISDASLYHWAKRLGLPLKHLSSKQKAPPVINFIELPLNDVCADISPDPASSKDAQEKPSALQSCPVSVAAPMQATPQIPQENASTVTSPLAEEPAYCVHMTTPHLNITLHLPWPQVMAMIKTLA